MSFVNSDNKSSNLTVPSWSHRFIIGKGGKRKRQLEEKYNISIQFPEKSNKNDTLTIKHRSGVDLSSFKIELDNLVQEARLNHPPTHFVAVPIDGIEIRNNIEIFRENCINQLGLPSKVLKRYSKLHLTFCVLKILDNDKLEKAQRTLQRFSADIPKLIGSCPLDCSLKNLRTFSGTNVRRARVVYADIEVDDGSERLQNLADNCLRFFVDSGVTTYAENHHKPQVLLHCTLINARWGNLKEIDVSGLFNDVEQKDHFFGKFLLRSIELNEMTSDRESETYVKCGTIPIVSGPPPLKRSVYYSFQR